MRLRVFFYFFQLLVYSALFLVGCDRAGIEPPSPLAAPWLWAIIAIAPLVPWRWSGWDGVASFHGHTEADGD